MLKALLSITLLTTLLLSSLAPAHAVQAPSPLKPFIIDTDMAADDWIAMLYLLQRTDIEVKAITVTGTGEAHCAPGVQNALDLVALVGKPNIPVTCGREMPLVGDRTFPDAWRQNVDALSGLSLPHNPAAPAAQSAPDLLIDLIRTSPTPITLVTLGPLTNLAEALQTAPDIVANLSAVYIMGGAVEVNGNVENSAAEWNFYIDPAADDIVLRSGAPLFLVSLDATNHIPVTMDFLENINQDRTTPAAEFVYRVLGANVDFIRSGGYFFWDPLTALASTEPSVVQFTEQHLIIEANGQDSGATRPDASGASIMVANTPDATQFELVFLNVLNGRQPQ